MAFRIARAVTLLMLAFAGIALLIAGPLLSHGFAFDATVKFCAMTAIALAIGFLQFGHAGLASGVALAPLPAVALVLFLTAHFALPFSPLLTSAFDYILGFAVALALGDGFAAEIAKGASHAEAVRAAWRSEAPAVAAIVVMAVLPPTILALAGGATAPSAALSTALANAAAILCVLAIVPLASLPFSFGEDYIAQSNRARENGSRRLDFFADTVRPRWSWSGTGILFVFAAVAVVGNEKLRVGEIAKLGPVGIAVIGFGVLLIAATIAARAWRRALALAIVGETGLLLFCLGLARAGADLDTQRLLVAFDILALLFAPLAVVTVSAVRATRAGDDTATSSATAIVRKGPIVVVMAICGIILLAPWYRELGVAGLGALLALVFAAAAALIFLPALTNVVEAIVPYHRGIAERYTLK